MRGWYALIWVVFGLCPGLVAVLGDTGTQRYGSVAVLGAMGVGYALVTLLPEHQAIQLTYLVLLVPAVGAMGYLPGGGAALFVLTLPQFWLLTRTPWQAVGVSSAAAAAVVVGALARTAGAVSGNAVVAAAAFAVSVPIGVWWHQNEQRTHALGDELARTQQELAEAHRREGAAQERDRLAREVHDTLAQGFASITALAEAARVASDPEQHSRLLTSIETTARENLAEARVLVGSAPAAAPGPLTQSLRRTLDRFAEDTRVTVNAELADVDPDPHLRGTLLRCAQESLANVRKHASATTITVVLTQRQDTLELEITDDGRGFVVADARGFGIDGMRRRLAELGGELTVTSSVGDGTRVLAELPIQKDDHS
ncbi:MAG: sensor histidine kinase [Pseudonocardiaceae bacterium]|nr:sensor histidine kinase [Pseudonocardiaceae bacterium]